MQPGNTILGMDFKLPVSCTSLFAPVLFPYGKLKKSERARLHVQLANMIDSSGYDYRGVPVYGSEPSFLSQPNSKSSGPFNNLPSTAHCPLRSKARESSLPTIILEDLPRSEGSNYGIRLEKRIRKNNGVVPSPLKQLLRYNRDDNDDEDDNSPNAVVTAAAAVATNCKSIAGSNRLSILKRAIAKETTRNELLGTILKRKRSLLLIQNGVSCPLATKVRNNVSLTEVD
jgi:hypothetical protein